MKEITIWQLSRGSIKTIFTKQNGKIQFVELKQVFALIFLILIIYEYIFNNFRNYDFSTIYYYY